MVEIRGKWVLVDGLVSAFMVVFFTMALLDYWPPSPYDLILIVGLAVTTAWALALGVMLVRNTLQARRRSRRQASAGPT